MSDDVTAKLNARKVALEDEFKALQDRRTALVEQRKVIDQSLSEINARQLQLQGSYAEVVELIGEKPIPVEEPAKKPTKK